MNRYRPYGHALWHGILESDIYYDDLWAKIEASATRGYYNFGWYEENIRIWPATRRTSNRYPDVKMQYMPSRIDDGLKRFYDDDIPISVELAHSWLTSSDRIEHYWNQGRTRTRPNGVWRSPLPDMRRSVRMKRDMFHFQDFRRRVVNTEVEA